MWRLALWPRPTARETRGQETGGRGRRRRCPRGRPSGERGGSGSVTQTMHLGAGARRRGGLSLLPEDPTLTPRREAPGRGPAKHSGSRAQARFNSIIHRRFYSAAGTAPAASAAGGAGPGGRMLRAGRGLPGVLPALPRTGSSQAAPPLTPDSGQRPPALTISENLEPRQGDGLRGGTNNCNGFKTQKSLCVNGCP